LSRLFTILLLLLVLSLPCNSQSNTGIPGYVHIPTATFNHDGTLYLGSSFLPKKYLPYSKDRYDAVAFYAGLTFLPFLEVNIRATRLLNLPQGSNHVVDRMPSLRFRLLKEEKYLPSVVIGAHDFITTLESGVARHFGATYLVLTKATYIDRLSTSLEATIGYGTDWLKSGQNEFVGFWGGISLKNSEWNFLSLMVEYDGKTTNAGMQLVLLKHLHLTAGLLNFDTLTGSISYHVRLGED